MSLLYITRASDPNSSLRSSLGLMLQKQTLVDMTLICSSHSIRVHKSVLAANSPYLESVITKFKDDVILVLRYMSFEALRGLVEFMYCGRTKIEETHLKEMIAAGNCLSVTGLSNLSKMEGRIQNDSTHGPSKFEITPVGESTINRPLIFIKRNERNSANLAKVPIVIEINPGKSSSKSQSNRKENTKVVNVPADNNIVNEIQEVIKSEDTIKILNVSETQQTESEDILQVTNDVEILRIPFELKNNKPVRNQIKEFIGETMPELILKPRRGRPSVKPIMERSLIKNNYLYQITLDNSDDTLRCEETMSRRTIAKMEKQLYGRDIQQQFVIEQAVSSIVGMGSPTFDVSNHSIRMLKSMSTSPEMSRNDEMSNSNDFTDMNLLLDNDYYTNEIVPQTLSISDIEALNADGNVEYQNLDELSNLNNLSYNIQNDNEINFTILPNENNDNIEYTYLDGETQIEGDSVVFNTGDIPVIDYETNSLFLSQFNYALDNTYYDENELNEHLMLQSNLSDIQFIEQPVDTGSNNDNGQNTVMLNFGNSSQENENENDNISSAMNEVKENSGVNSNQDHVYESDTDIFQVIKNNEDIGLMVNDNPLKVSAESMNSDNDVLNALQDSDANTNVANNNSSSDASNSWLHNYNACVESAENILDSPDDPVVKVNNIINLVDNSPNELNLSNRVENSARYDHNYELIGNMTDTTDSNELSSYYSDINSELLGSNVTTFGHNIKTYSRRNSSKENVSPPNNHSNKSMPMLSGVQETVESLPVRNVLERIQNITDRKPRQTRANSSLDVGSKRSMGSPSEKFGKKRKTHRTK